MVSLRDFLASCRKEGDFLSIEEELSTEYEISAVMRALDGGPVLCFEKVRGHEDFKVIANLCNRRRLLKALGVKDVVSAYRKLMEAKEKPSEPEVVDSGPWEEVEPDLTRLPVLKHYEGDAGPYITSAVISAKSPDGSVENVSVHRLLVFDGRKMAIRLVPRHLYRLWQMAREEGHDLGIGIAIGVHPAVILASTTPVPFGVSEFYVANTLLNGQLKLVECEEVDARVPSEAEIVIEGRLKAYETAPEGPLVDITGTYDAVRQQPVVEVLKIWIREEPYYHAILPGGLEHRLFMGFPREAEVWKAVSQVVPSVKAVNLTPGGCGWLHAAIAIEKNVDGDAKNAILAAFSAHPSLKHVVVVDPDIDIYDPEQVEWAIATRFQADEDLVVIRNVRGSTLDPSADQETGLTTKVGLDATVPLGRDRKAFEKASIPVSQEVRELLRRLGPWRKG
ncbi:UbiD family decarboxylase [Candidatus Bathyarchaeota archaeon ex4484_135]|nr:MAG: UbiD family decarboxylase [Candidatus Bathyarchaeota archaeon ex4484_135]